MQYDWDTLTAAQASAFKATDTVWAGVRDIARISVTFDDANRTFTITDSFLNRSLVFSSDAYGAKLDFGQSAKLVVGSIQADYVVSMEGYKGKVFAGAGADTVTASASYTVSGGAGDDVLVVPHGGQVADLERGDRLYFGAQAATASNYQERSATDATQADSLARSLLGSGSADYVAVAVGADVYVYGDSFGDNLTGSGLARVTLIGRTLDDVSFETFRSGPTPTAPVLPGPPTTNPPASNGAAGASGFVLGNMDNVHLARLQGAAINQATPTSLNISGGGGGGSLTLGGTGLAYDSNQQLVAGVVKTLAYVEGPSFAANLTFSNSVSATPFGGWVATDATQTAFASLLAANDTLGGSAMPDLIRSYGGDDILYGAGGQDSLFGGGGNDAIHARFQPGQGGGPDEGATYLRGEEGDDLIVGSPKFDDINGNQGNDSGSGGDGDDWVVGGRDNDVLAGDAGSDLVYGNLGSDTCDGGLGSDVVRGGQDNDVVYGGAGDDFVSGDRGADTMTGGLGADIFHTFGDAGLDRVTDFSMAAGDRVQLDPGTQYTVSQVDADTVINMTGGGQMVLVGVQMSSLTPGWIFGT